MGALPILRATGLQTAHNPFSGVSDGSLSLAKNVVVFSNHVLEPRRGHRQFPYTLSPSEPLRAGAFFGSTLLVQYDNSLAYDTGSAFSTYAGTFAPVDNTLLRMKFVEAQGNLYFNTDNGVLKIESASDTPAGSNPLPPSWSDYTLGSEMVADGAGWVANNERIGFRMTYVYVDSNGVEYESAPSRRQVLTNSTGGAAILRLAWAGDRQLDVANTRIRFYRTAAAASSDPGDEMFLFYEQPAEVYTLEHNRTFENNPGSLSASPLYTNARTGDGVLQANNHAPLAKDITYWGNRMWYLNTTGKQRLALELLGVGSPDGIQAADALTISAYEPNSGRTFAMAYTANAVGNSYLIQRWLITTGGTASANIEASAKALEHTINNQQSYNTATFDGTTVVPGDPESPVRAYYVSGVNDSPGKLLLEAYRHDTPAFHVYASRPESWNPEPGTTLGTALTSDPDRRPNGLYYSKPDQPESVPLLNYLLIGAKNKEGLRAVPLRDKLVVFKEDGIFTVAGDEPFTVDLLDEKTRLVSPDSAVVLNNSIYCLSNQGVVSVSDVGVQILSRPIEDQLLPYLTDAMRPLVKRHAFGVAHETDRTYELWLPGSPTDSRICPKAFVYSTVTQAWTVWEVSGGRTFGVVSPTDVRYYGGPDGKVYKERRDFASTDYADDYQSVTITNYNGTTITPSSMSGIEVGDVLLHTESGGSQSVVITAVGATTFTVSEAILTAFQSGATTTIEKAFECDVRWNPVAYERPGSLKRFQYGTLHFGRPSAFNTAYAAYETELSAAVTTEPISTVVSGWGSSAWGSGAWGDSTKQWSARHTIPAEKQRAAMLYPGFKIREAFAGWKLHGITLDTEETSERTSRGA